MEQAIKDGVLPSFLVDRISDLFYLLCPFLVDRSLNSKDMECERELTCCISINAPMAGIILAVIANGSVCDKGAIQGRWHNRFAPSNVACTSSNSLQLKSFRSKLFLHFPKQYELMISDVMALRAMVNVTGSPPVCSSRRLRSFDTASRMIGSSLLMLALEKKGLSGALL